MQSSSLWHLRFYRIIEKGYIKLLIIKKGTFTGGTKKLHVILCDLTKAEYYYYNNNIFYNHEESLSPLNATHIAKTATASPLSSSTVGSTSVPQ